MRAKVNVSTFVNGTFVTAGTVIDGPLAEKAVATNVATVIDETPKKRRGRKKTNGSRSD